MTALTKGLKFFACAPRCAREGGYSSKRTDRPIDRRTQEEIRQTNTGEKTKEEELGRGETKAEGRINDETEEERKDDKIQSQIR
jgi:hypothetical protein